MKIPPPQQTQSLAFPRRMSASHGQRLAASSYYLMRLFRLGCICSTVSLIADELPTNAFLFVSALPLKLADSQTNLISLSDPAHQPAPVQLHPDVADRESSRSPAPAPSVPSAPALLPVNDKETALPELMGEGYWIEMRH